MRWPWATLRSTQRLVLRGTQGRVAYALTSGAPEAGAPPKILRWGLLETGESLGFNGADAIALLEPDDYQVLRVDTPQVPNAELKAAARWQVKELVSQDLDQLTLDVMHVGGDVERAQRQIFVVTARNSAIVAVNALAAAATGGGQAPLRVVDIWETALRNLLTAQASRDELTQRACGLILLDESHSILVIGAAGELHYTRRLDNDPQLLAQARGGLASDTEADAPLGFEYRGGGDFDATAQDSPLVTELQRSIDVWERSWPDLPLARLYVVSSQYGAEIAALIQRELGQRTVALDVLAQFAGPAPAPTGTPGPALAACIPVLGAALRDETRQL
jgi:MSHA biogenesis protein MshI